MRLHSYAFRTKYTFSAELAVLWALVLAVGTGQAAGAPPHAKRTQAIKTTPSHSDTSFLRGMDLSMLQYLQDHQVTYKDAGNVKDPVTIFQEHGVNYARLRLFVNPSGRDGQVNSMPYTLRLARRVKKAGLRLLLDIHYSDEWADPTHQTIPAAWKTLSHPQLVQRVFTYTRDAVAVLGREGCLPDMVEVGNEITNGMVWPAGGPLSAASRWNDITSHMAWPEKDRPSLTQWDGLADLLKAGIRGVRASDLHGTVKIMIHIDKGGNEDVSRRFFAALQHRDVLFNVIGLSYYPFWHGTLADLAGNLAFLSRTYHKDIVVVETGYDWNGGDQGTLPFPLTADGQKAFLEALIHTVAATPGGHGKGVFYWAPEWIRGRSWDGPSWSPVWENRALFDHSGNALPALQAFESTKNRGR